MTRSELLAELERLRHEAAMARDNLQGLLKTVRSLKDSLPPATTEATASAVAPSPGESPQAPSA